jgi:hypothetical protein
MSDTQNPTPADPTGGSGDESLRDAIEEAVDAHEDDGAGAMADHLRDRVEETEAEPEAPGDRED